MSLKIAKNCLHICVSARLNEVLIHVLNALQLFLPLALPFLVVPVAVFTRAQVRLSTFGICIQKVEQLDERVVWHVVASVTELFPLDPDVVILVVFVVAVVGLCLQRWPLHVRI